jgi:hypothetical protein
MDLISDELVQQSSLVLEVFPEKVDAFYMIADRVFEDVVKAEKKKHRDRVVVVITSFIRLQNLFLNYWVELWE